jgi:hypothetical protein
MDLGDAVPLCGMYGVGGMNGQEFKTEIQMFSATIQTDAHNAVSVELTRLPSDINYLRKVIFGTPQLF